MAGGGVEAWRRGQSVCGFGLIWISCLLTHRLQHEAQNELCLQIEATLGMCGCWRGRKEKGGGSISYQQECHAKKWLPVRPTDRDAAAACPCPCSTVRVKFCGKMHSCASNSESDEAQPRLQPSGGGGVVGAQGQTDRQTHVLTCVGSASAAAHPHIRIWRSGVAAAGNILFCERNDEKGCRDAAGGARLAVCVAA